MAIEVKRKKGETFEAFVRRFNRRLMQSGVVLEFKKRLYNRKDMSRNLQKADKISRKEYREKKEYLKKIGRIPEETNTRRRRY
ncbi:hypothetical protein HN858_00385 [Candidatus Falkowbacteria bacterium]|jgi:hypothetical protein|nr:hypothetical protein [Candidatus Falkowbacteria bacterium]MBT5503626.1 hypothetical protein [Candidatus Falkowbacteria bacterium]MBT6574486.1 hypothetical protein [Candidatus Falkowbacteria bacterium]MBT7348110.1 hypothetical protein [Candidatus Falkowbacteria bacterium]MBT7500753.1 hypothetical protein [Candidatus Falkowbacteria bacterium]